MEFIYRLLKYNYTTYCQGSADVGVGWALLQVPSDSTFNNSRSVLINKKHIEGVYEIDIDSVTDESITW